MAHLHNRARRPAVALETTLLCHGVPRAAAEPLAADLTRAIAEGGAHPAIVGVVHGRPTVGLTSEELAELLEAREVPKLNTANLGLALHRSGHGATTVSATMELAAAAGVRVFATGGIGGIHRGYSQQLDVSADLAALARWPVAVVASGAKTLLDVPATREALEALGVPVVGFRTDRFPGFYLVDGGADLDARFDDPDELASFVGSELTRSGRGVLVANPVPEESAIAQADWELWLKAAQAGVGEALGRDATPATLAELHRVSAGRTLEANLALVRSNARLAAQLAVRIAMRDKPM